jgi:hypothetical protein
MPRFPKLPCCLRALGGFAALAFPLALAAQGMPPAPPPTTAAPGAVTPTSGVQVRRSDGSVVTLSLAQLAALPHQTISATVRGVTAQYSGISLTAVLSAAAVGPVDSIGGLRLRLVVLVTGADGYRVAFSLAELDRTIGHRQVLLADRVDGAAIKGDDGPLRLAVPEDGRPTRWVRGVTRIDVIYPP